MKRVASFAITTAIFVIAGCAGLLGLDEGSPITDGDALDAAIPDSLAPEASACPSGTHACGDQCLSNVSVASCGPDCVTCAAGDHAQATCGNGACGVLCDDGFGHCTATTPESCETPTNTTANCGTCGAACIGALYCAPKDGGGTECSNTCPLPNLACGSTCSNHDTDSQNCGGCGNLCTTGDKHASPSCSGGSCSFTCHNLFHKCNRGGVDECDDNSSTASCGPTSCTACPAPPADGTATCNGTACGMQCAAGYVALAGTCRAFGGAYQRPTGAPATCLVGNSLIAGSPCACPPDFQDVPIPNIAAFDSSSSVIHICQAAAFASSSDWGGASLHDDSRAGASGCLAVNPYTGGCGTCPNPTSVQYFKLYVYGGVGSLTLKAGTLTVCGPNLAGPGRSFLGAWEQFVGADVIVPGGDACISGNKQQGGLCACGVGQKSVSLQAFAQGTTTANETVTTDVPATATFCFP